MAARLFAPEAEPPSAEASTTTPTAEAVDVDAPATAEVEQPSIELPRTKVIIGFTVDDPLVTGADLKQALAAQLADTGLQHRVATLASDSDHGLRVAWATTFEMQRDVLAVFWIEGTSEARKLYMYDPDRGKTWMRRLETSSDPDELIVSLGTIVRGISLATAAGAPSGMEEVEPPKPTVAKEEPKPPPKEEPKPPPPPPPKTLWSIELAYEGGNLSSNAPWLSAGSLGLDVELPFQLVARVAASMYGPLPLSGPPETTVWRLPVNVGVGYRFRHRDVAFRPMVDASLVVEPMWWQADTTPDVTAFSGRTVRIAVAPGAGFRARLWKGLGVLVHARADLRVRNADLVVSDQERRVSRLSPHGVAATARAGLYYSF